MQELLDLQRELDRLFGAELYPHLSFSQKGFPLVNIFERDQSVVLKAEMPGVSKKDLDLELKEGVIRVSGRRVRELGNDEFFHRRERNCGEFTRQFKLPASVDPEKVRASFSDGILTVELEKSEASKGRRISIR